MRGIFTRYQTQQSAKDHARSGRPPRLSRQDREQILILIGRDPFITCREIKRELGFECYSRTILAYLKKENIVHRKALRRPKLSEKVAARRLRFAREHVDKPPEF